MDLERERERHTGGGRSGDGARATHGADINADFLGATPLHFALHASEPEYIVECLLNNNADVEKVSSGSTPLILAASKGLTRCIKLLLDKGANPDIKNSNGKVAVEVAASGMFLDSVEVLFPCTAPLEAYTNWTIQEIVMKNRHESGVVDLGASNGNIASAARRQQRNVSSSCQLIASNSGGPNTTTVVALENSGEKHYLGIASFMCAALEKTPALIVTLSVIGFTAAHISNGEKEVLTLSGALFNFLCFCTIVSVHSTLLLNSYAAYLKEVQTEGNMGIRIASAIALISKIYLLLVFCTILIGLEKGNKFVILSAAAIVLVMYVLTWPCRNKYKTLLGLIKELWDQRQLRIREDLRRQPSSGG